MDQLNFQRLDDGSWGVKAQGYPAPHAKPGDTVQIRTRSGAYRTVTLGQVEARWNGGRAVVFRVVGAKVPPAPAPQAPAPDPELDAWEAEISDDIRSHEEYVLATARAAFNGEHQAARQLAYYDETDYVRPAIPNCTVGEAQHALYTAWSNSLTGSSVGGYCTPDVRDNSDGTWTFTRRYHIGD